MELMHGKRPTIHVNVPTRWATNFFVIDSQLDSRQALQMAAASEEWEALPAGSKASEVRDLLLNADYWRDADMLVRLLRPFSDAIHQLEGDNAHLADCHVALITLREHVVQWTAKYSKEGREASSDCLVTGRALATIDRRLKVQPGGALAPVYNPAYSAAYALDPYYADIGGRGHCFAPTLEADEMGAAHALVLRVGGEKAGAQFMRMFTQGYPKSMQPVVASVAAERVRVEAVQEPGRKRDRVAVPSSIERIRVWTKFGSELPELRDVALRLLSAHATSASAERNWSLWGRVYCAARSSLGLERAKALIAICAAETSKTSSAEAFQMTLDVVEDTV
jgi:hypothetical protein